MTTVSAKLPKIVCVTDYHEFDQISDLLNSFLNKKVRVKEIGFARGDGYVGVAYTGRRPNAKQIEALCVKSKISLSQEGYG